MKTASEIDVPVDEGELLIFTGNLGQNFPATCYPGK